MNETVITKILPNEKIVWVKIISRKYFDSFKQDGWKVYAYSDTQEQHNLEVKDVSIHEGIDADN